MNLPITSAFLRLVVMWMGAGSTSSTYSGARMPRESWEKKGGFSAKALYDFHGCLRGQHLLRLLWAESYVFDLCL